MKKIINFIFGNPYAESKYWHVFYWFGVVFYLLALIIFVSQAIFNGGWWAIWFLLIGFPLMFRLVYKLNTMMYKSLKGLNKRVIVPIVIVFVLFTIIIAVLPFLLGENVVMNTSKSVVNGNVNLSIGSLKGYYDVETLEITETPQGTIEIPYHASVGEGSFILSVEHSDKTVWQEEVLSEENGLIEFDGVKGSYEINIFTEEAKKININLLLQ